ncbi:glucose-6-phosphatase [Scaptodrosophila lebanonensis]|uniref:glucose-6-phosphatase n=1 Tax=Drosophila lebanonensis TaxID=7225 RepID=A0A6J2TRU6_DROLE|nr:glucose-6-phosphatase [Scaptodrosophila lebanonensis]
MELDAVRLAADFYRNMLNAELFINEWVQERLSSAEPFWRLLSVYIEPGNLMNLIIPVVGIFRQEMLIHLVFVVSLVSALNSFEKWIYPELRPLWWLRELYANEKAYKPQVALQAHELSCETSGGMPCTHSMSFTVFMLILISYLFVYCHQRFKCWRPNTWRIIAYSVITGCVCCVWLSRLYFATEFLHQCVLGSYFGVRAMNSFEKHTDYLYSRPRAWSVLVIVLLGCVAIAVYFVKLHLGVDPHWSVRQAFKWCPEPTYMRHEASPIFMLVRDLGNLMGVALASPLANIKESNTRFWRRFSMITLLELLNFGIRLATPKQHGRFAFLAFEFIRNSIHSFALVKLIK